MKNFHAMLGMTLVASIVAAVALTSTVEARDFSNAHPKFSPHFDGGGYHRHFPGRRFEYGYGYGYRHSLRNRLIPGLGLFGAGVLGYGLYNYRYPYYDYSCAVRTGDPYLCDDYEFGY